MHDYRVISNEVYDTYEEYETYLEEEFAKTTLVLKFFKSLHGHDCEHLMHVTNTIATVAAVGRLRGMHFLSMLNDFFNFIEFHGTDTLKNLINECFDSEIFDLSTSYFN